MRTLLEKSQPASCVTSVGSALDSHGTGEEGPSGQKSSKNNDGGLANIHVELLCARHCMKGLLAHPHASARVDICWFDLL